MTPFISYELRIKTVSLADEQTRIHSNESRLKGQIKHIKKLIKNAVKTGDLSKIEDYKAYLARHRQDRDSLHGHRMWLRPMARAALLSYGFLKGRAYSKMEPKRYSNPDWAQIERNIIKYGMREGLTEQVIKQRLEQWKQEGGEVSFITEDEQFDRASARRARLDARKKVKMAAE
jgi:hypothetical protein